MGRRELMIGPRLVSIWMCVNHGRNPRGFIGLLLIGLCYPHHGQSNGKGKEDEMETGA